MSYKRLTRSNENKMIAGVCAGIAEYFNVDPTLVRIAYVLVCCFTVFLPSVIAYLALCVIMPQK